MVWQVVALLHVAQVIKMDNEYFIKKFYLTISNRKGNTPFLLDDVFTDEVITQENKDYVDSLIESEAFFLQKIDEDKYIKTYRIEEACNRTVKELEKEEFNSEILQMLQNDPIILHNELKKWFDTKHNSMLSYVVDKYWHNFVLYAKEYEDWCYENYNCFFYHSPKFLHENKNISDEEILLDVIEYFKIYTQQHTLDDKILLYNFPFLLFKNNIEISEIKEIILELAND